MTHVGDAALSVGRLEVNRLVVNEIIEKAAVKPDVLTGTPNINLEDEALHYFTSNASANWTFNFRGGSGTTLDSMMNTNDVMTVTILTTHGGTAYIPSGTNADCRVKIDGSDTTVNWSGGSAPTAGNDNGIDAYTYSIIKTGGGAFTVIGSQTAYG